MESIRADRRPSQFDGEILIIQVHKLLAAAVSGPTPYLIISTDPIAQPVLNPYCMYKMCGMCMYKECKYVIRHRVSHKRPEKLGT
jgi:hypothetical protein